MTIDESADRREYRTSRTRLKQGYLLGGVLAAIGIIVFLAGRKVIPDAVLIALGHMAVGAGIVVHTWRQAQDPRPRLVLDTDGIWFRDWNTRPIPWSQVRAIGTAGSRMSSFVSVEIRDAQTLLHLIPPADRQKFRTHRLVRLPRLFIPNNSVDIPFDGLVEALKAGQARFSR